MPLLSLLDAATTTPTHHHHHHHGRNHCRRLTIVGEDNYHFDINSLRRHQR